MGQIFIRNDNKEDAKLITPYSSSGANHNRNKSKSNFQNKKNSYLDLNNKYQLSNQRFTTIRQYEKLPSMVMRNFGKILERGKNRGRNKIPEFQETENIIKDYEKTEKFRLTNIKDEDFKEVQKETPNETYLNLEKNNDFLDNSKQLLMKNEEIVEEEDNEKIQKNDEQKSQEFYEKHKIKEISNGIDNSKNGEIE